jgi:heptosyltransferase-2
MRAPRKILAIKLRALGDTVLMTAPLLELRRAYPEAEIHAVVHTPWAPLLEGHPAVDRVWAYERHPHAASRANALARLALKLRRQGFDCVVNFHASPSSSVLAFATGAPLRSIHFHGHRDKNRYSTVTIPGKGILKPIIERDMDTVRALGVHVPAGRLPEIPIPASERAQAASRLAQLNLPYPVLGLALGASRPTKAWPASRYAQLAIDWCLRTQGGALAITGPHEEKLVQEFLIELDEALTQRGLSAPERAAIRGRIASDAQASVRPAAATLSALAVLAGNDSGPRHLAVAVGTPTVTIFGPESPYEWHPYLPERHPFLFVEGLECRRDADPGMPAWCGLEVCIVEKHRCMRQIGSEAVLAECLRLLKARAA